jgi:hypothetical protein
LVSFFIGILVSEFRVKKLVLDTFLLSSTYRLTLIGIGMGNSIVNSRLQRISLISFLRDLIIS